MSESVHNNVEDKSVLTPYKKPCHVYVDCM